MTAGFLFQTKTSSQEIITVFNTNEEPIEFFIQRKNTLNLGEITSGKITQFNKTLKGYFVLTDKNISVFVPSTQKLSEGQDINVSITKEARLGKDATGSFTMDAPFCPNLKEEVLKKYPSFEFKNNIDILPVIEEALEETIPFAQGATLFIERTNALWTIDIDSGNSPFSLFEINQKAVSLIYKQIQLKNMAGMILIDFAGYKSSKDKNQLRKAIKNEFKDDSRTKIYDFSNLNLFEIKRARTSAALVDLFYTKEGLKKPDYINLCIREQLLKCKHGKPVLEIHPSYALYLTEEIKNNVVLQQNLNIKPDFFELKEK